ncbi:hypothetical protein SAMN03159463_00363 [Mesorhizobium sp. NFR06]|nr:hypothetical protein SAMN03159463_00363 [Mesorhizobium sp. NFR06]
MRIAAYRPIGPVGPLAVPATRFDKLSRFTSIGFSQVFFIKNPPE